MVPITPVPRLGAGLQAGLQYLLAWPQMRALASAAAARKDPRTQVPAPSDKDDDKTVKDDDKTDKTVRQASLPSAKNIQDGEGQETPRFDACWPSPPDCGCKRSYRLLALSKLTPFALIPLGR